MIQMDSNQTYCSAGNLKPGWSLFREYVGQNINSKFVRINRALCVFYAVNVSLYANNWREFNDHNSRVYYYLDL